MAETLRISRGTVDVNIALRTETYSSMGTWYYVTITLANGTVISDSDTQDKEKAETRYKNAKELWGIP